MKLPNITIEDPTGLAVRRLPLDFGPVISAIFEEAGRLHARGLRLLPFYYSLGILEDGAFAMPDGAVIPQSLQRN